MNVPVRTTEEIESLVVVIKDLYISMRKRWITQKRDGSGYSQISHYALHDDYIRNHLKGTSTIGIFARTDYVKFITFDVDSANHSIARWQTLRLIDVLLNEFRIKRDNLLISFSGSKGYHVTFFFDDVLVSPAKARRFYKLVLEKLEATEDEIEFRPENTIGVKLPLGINRKSGAYCYFVDLEDLERVSDSVIFDVVKVDCNEFIENLDEFKTTKQQVKKQQIKQDIKQNLNLPQSKEQQIIDVLDNVKIEIPIDYEERMTLMLEQNCLLYPNSRHNSTYLLCIYLKEEYGLSRDDTEGIVRSIIMNTYENARELISEKTSLKEAITEVTRLCDYVYVNDKKIEYKGITKRIRIYENEILELLKSNKINLMKLAFIMLLHSKKYARGKNRIFYMTYEQMAEYGADTNRRVLRQLEKLESLEFLDIVERNRRVKGKSLPNLYRVNVIPNQAESFIEFDVNDVLEMNLEDVVTKLIPKRDIKKILSKKVYEYNFDKYYEEII